ncbi:TPA: hypothetical protein ACS1FU_001936 [Klebsiella aerogenes]
MTSKLTRERQQEIAEDGFLKHGESKVLARMALATMDSKPVAVVEPSDYVTAAQLVGEGPARKAVHELYEGALRIGDKLYRHAQPATALPDFDDVLEILDYEVRCNARESEYVMQACRAMYDACRAAMLNGGMKTIEPTPTAALDDLLSMAASAIEDLLEHTDPNTSYYSGVWADVPGKLRAAMLQAGNCRENENSSTNNFREIAETSTNSPVVPDGYVMVPMRLTAENGAKGALSGEFSETKFVNCPECFGDDECETCDGSGRIEIKVPVSWTTIKEIWIKSVEHFAAAPQENN